MALAAAVAHGRRRWVWGLVALAVLFAALLVAFNLPGSPMAPLRDVPVLGRFGQIAETGTGSEAVRVRVWGAVNELLAGEPARLAVGHGPESLKYSLLPYGEANLPGRAQADRLVDRSHNVLLDALAMTGVPGALALLLVFGAWLFTAVSRLGLVPERRDGRWLAGLLALGTLAGAATWLVWPTYAAALTVLGTFAGLTAYLLRATVLRLPAPEAAPRPMALALLAVGAAVVVEAATGIQTVATQMVFWLAAGLVVAHSAGDADAVPEAAAGAPARRRRGGRAERGEAERPEPDKDEGGGGVTISWSAGGAALGIALGTVMGLFFYSYFIFGTARLPDTVGVVGLMALATWLVGAVLAHDAGESAFACAVASLVALGAYLVVRAATLALSADAAVLFAVSLWWLVALALLGGVALRASTRRARLASGPVALIYPVLAVFAVVAIFLRGARPVQADIYFQSAMANAGVALANDDQERFQTAEELFRRAVPPGTEAPGFRRAVTYLPGAATYYMKWAEFYTRVGSGILAAPEPSLEAAAMAFNRAQELLAGAESLEPLMPYHVFNRGHLQLVFAEALPPEQQAAVATNAATALRAAFDVLKRDPRVANEFAVARMLEGRREEAVALLEYSLDLDPENPETLSLLGRAYSVVGRTEDAERVYERAMTAGMGGAELYVGLGDLARERGDLSAALSHYVQAAEEEPGNWAVLFNLGLLYRDVGEAEQAVNALMAALRVAPAAEAERIQEAIDSVMTGGEAVPVTP
jgi:tetratricopeptide (TPR) repeat protein